MLFVDAVKIWFRFWLVELIRNNQTVSTAYHDWANENQSGSKGGKNLSDPSPKNIDRYIADKLVPIIISLCKSTSWTIFSVDMKYFWKCKSTQQFMKGLNLHFPDVDSKRRIINALVQKIAAETNTNIHHAIAMALIGPLYKWAEFQEKNRKTIGDALDELTKHIVS